MAGPSWLAGAFAAVMVLTAGYSASRLVAFRRRGLAIEADADGLHAVMGAAMAGMLVSQLNLLPRTTWMVVFGAGAAWFGGCAIRSTSPSRFSRRCRYPVPHLVECIAMLYMLQGARGTQHGAGMAMPGMNASPAGPAAFPALAVVLALFMLGYIVWTTDQLASLARATPGAVVARTPQHPALVTALVTAPVTAPVTVPADRAESTAAAIGTLDPAGTPDRAGTPDPPGTLLQDRTAGPALLAPRLAALGTIAMSITMGCMLILML